MNFLEQISYFFLFLINKYSGLGLTENWLNTFENHIINKYLPSSPIQPSPIPTIQASDLSDTSFKQLSNNGRSPILIKGYMKNTPAVNLWNLDYLKDAIHDFPINVINPSPQLTIENIPFNHFVDRIDDPLYCNNNHTIIGNFPTLFKDLNPDFNRLVKTLKSVDLKYVHIANLFIGYNNPDKKCTGSNMHSGGSGNFFCMITGQKHWTLIDPRYSCLLKGRVASSGIHAQTLFDMDKELTEVPEIFQRLPRYEVELEPGDILWNAPWWWHRIRNDSGLSIGMAIRNNKVTKLNLQNNLTYTLSGHTYLFYNSLLIKIYEKYLEYSQEERSGSTKNDTENTGDNVLYQIEKLMEKYPRSVELSDVLSN